MKFRTFIVTLILNTTIRFLHWTFQLKFECKKNSSYVNMVETVIFAHMSPQCDLNLEDSKPVFLHDTLAHDDASPYKVWSQKDQHLRRYRPDEHSLEFWTFPVTLTTTEQSNLLTIKLMVVCHQTKFSCKKTSSLEKLLGPWCITTPSLVTKGSAVQKISLE